MQSCAGGSELRVKRFVIAVNKNERVVIRIVHRQFKRDASRLYTLHY